MNEVGKELIKRELARRLFEFFIKYVREDYVFKPFHKSLIEICQAFVDTKIKRMMVSLPPQHGKSLLFSILLPTFLLCKNPNLKIAIVSYSFASARRLGLEIQRLLMSQEVNVLFPNVRLNSTKREDNSKYIQTQEEFEIVGYRGSVKCVGRGGSLTGHKVDVLIIDDIYKDYAEANSPVIRESVFDWYKAVAKTRLNNTAQEIFVFTRWHEKDLFGIIEKTSIVVNLTKREQLLEPHRGWCKINFPSIATKESKLNEFDGRNEGEPLWGEMHSLERLLEMQTLDNNTFECLYQGNPKPASGFLFKQFNIYNTLEESNIIARMAYIDVAEGGGDYFCCIYYAIGNDGYFYVLDVTYRNDDIEEITNEVVELIKKYNILEVDIESNSGGMAFARDLRKRLNNVVINTFYQSANKEARVLTNAANVSKFILMPTNWTNKYKDFADEVLNFKKIFKANKNDDGVDALTGVYEKGIEVLKQVNPFIFKKIDDLIKW